MIVELLDFFPDYSHDALTLGLMVKRNICRINGKKLDIQCHKEYLVFHSFAATNDDELEVLMTVCRHVLGSFEIASAVFIVVITMDIFWVRV